MDKQRSQLTARIRRILLNAPGLTFTADDFMKRVEDSKAVANEIADLFAALSRLESRKATGRKRYEILPLDLARRSTECALGEVEPGTVR